MTIIPHPCRQAGLPQPPAACPAVGHSPSVGTLAAPAPHGTHSGGRAGRALGSTWLCLPRAARCLRELSSFLQPPNTSLLPACVLGVREGALIQGPEGGMGKRQAQRHFQAVQMQSRILLCPLESHSTCWSLFCHICYIYAASGFAWQRTLEKSGHAGGPKGVFPATVVAAWAPPLPTGALHSWPSTEADVSGIFLFLPQHYWFNTCPFCFSCSIIFCLSAKYAAMWSKGWGN